MSHHTAQPPESESTPGKRARDVRLRLAPSESRALGVLALIGALGLLWVVLPVGVGVLLGTVFAFTTYPYYRALAKRTGRPTLAATSITAAVTIVVTGTIAGLAYLLVLKGTEVASAVPSSLAPGGSAERLVKQAETSLGALGFHPGSLPDKLRSAAGSAAGALATRAARFAGALMDSLLALLFMTATMFFVSRNWAELGKRAEHLLPLNPHHTRRLLREAQRLGRTVVIGNFGTALLQGAIAGVGFGIARVPEAALLGAMTAVTSLVPAVGTLVVWVPTSVFLLATDRTAAGIFVLVWGSLAVVGFCDYVARPRLIGSGEGMSGWMTLVSLFGGLELFGFVGVLLGPMIAGLALAALRLYERTRRFRLGLH